MADPQTTNRSYNVPVTGSDVGTWGVSLNENFSKIDNNLGGLLILTLSNTTISLSPTQAQYGTIQCTGNVTVDPIYIVFPANVTGWWTIGNFTTGVATFGITSATGNSAIFMPPGEFTQICIGDSSNPQYMSLGGRIGSYLDLCTTTVPSWITSCSVPPYLNCTGATFSSATYPVLANFLGGTTLPDLRGRGRFYMNQTTNRITSANSGIDGNTLLSSGGNELIQGHTHNASGTTGTESQTHSHSGVVVGGTPSTTGGGAFTVVGSLITGDTNSESRTHTHTFNITTGSTGAGNSQNMPPAVMSGICLIRAA